MPRKGLLSIILCTALLVVLLPAAAQAVVIGGVFEYDDPNSSLQSWIEDDLVAEFGQSPPYNYSVVTSLKITGGMASADYTFIKNHLNHLVTLDLSGFSGSFPSEAFEGCSSIETVRLPAGVAISEKMFYECSSLKTLVVGGGALKDGVIDLSDAVSFQHNAFYGCQSIETVRLPAGKGIPISMFNRCSKLKTLMVGNGAFEDGVVDLRGAASFKNHVFFDCGSIEAVRLPEGAAIPSSMFLGCSSLKTLVVGNGEFEDGVIDLSGYTPLSFGETAFYECSSIEAVRLPVGASISTEMFYKCSSLKTLGVGNGMLIDGIIDLSGYTQPSFGYHAFRFCSNIEIVRLPAGVAISSYMFNDCSSLSTVLFTGSPAPVIGTDAFTGSLAVAYVPDKDSGGYEAADFTSHFAEVRSITLPRFLTHPLDQTKTVGEAVYFSVTVEAGEPAPYELQWQLSTDVGGSWNDITAATGDRYDITSVDMTQDGYQYRCAAASLAGRANSAAAMLTVVPPAPGPVMPEVVTEAVYGVTVFGATLAGRITSNGGAAVTERGFVYATAPNPSIGGPSVIKVTAGSGMGGFTAEVTGLTARTTYYVRAYAINSQGTGYGANVTFTTRSGGGGGSSTSHYTVKASAGPGGKISPSGNVSVREGQSQTFTITPDEGYKIKKVEADGQSLGAVTSYTFENVRQTHTITAAFEAIEVPQFPESEDEETGPLVVNNPFLDVSEENWFYDEVLYVYGKGIMLGVSSHLFAPDTPLSRGMFVTLLYRMSGESGLYENLFSDIPAGAWYEKAAAWATAKGICQGIGDGLFAPEQEITREQLAVMLYNYARYKNYDVSAGQDTNILSYNDALTISKYAFAALQWACATGLIQGDDRGNLNPAAPATRAEAAAILRRFLG